MHRRYTFPALIVVFMIGDNAGAGASPKMTRGSQSTVQTSITEPMIAGCSLFPPDNPWRRDISGEPLDPHSSAWVASVGLSAHLHADFGSDPTYGIPYVAVPASQPKVPVVFTQFADESDP